METARFCDFCGKHQDFVEYLIAGPKVHICVECVDIAVQIVNEGRQKKDDPTPPKPSKEQSNEQAG